MMSQAGDALTMREVAENERPLLRTMFEAYSREIIPHSSVVQDPAYNARYFEARLARDVDSGQWWAAINETIVGFANVERGEK